MTNRSRRAAARRFLRYGAVSVITMPLGQLTLFVGQFRWSARTANVVAVFVTAFVSYWLSRAWVWEASGTSRRWRDIGSFVVVVVAGLLLSTWAAGWTADHARRVTTSPWLTKLLVNGAAFITFVLVWLGRFLVLDRVFAADEAAEG